MFLELVKNLAVLQTAGTTFILFTDTCDATKVTHIKNVLEIVGKKNFTIVSLQSKNRFTWNALTLPKYLRKNPVDIYHTQYIVPFFIPKKTKVITHIHDVSFAANPKWISFVDLFFLKRLMPQSLHRADAIIAVSLFTKKEVMKYYGVPKEKIVVIYNAVPTNFESSSNRSITARQLQLHRVREKYHLPKKYIFALGTMQPRKNIPFLMEAFALIAEKIPDTSLVLSGTHTHNVDKKIERIFNKHRTIKGRMIFTGYIAQEDLPYVYRCAHLFAFPSFYEGFGIPLLEAMHSDVPVLASDIPPHRELVGDAALLAPTEDLVAFSQSLYTLCTNESIRERFRLRGKKQVRVFSWEKSAKKLLRLYNVLLKRT